ncbi:hypothetical protein BRDID11002_77160 [Bradyrhizobium diazoefficiens]
MFFSLSIIIGVVAWLFVLAQQSRRAAEAETRRQTTLLIQEIDAHKRTDAELQRAKEVAESANLAKSRYVVGLSHELRSPLNAISGYAQLLEQDTTLNTKPRDQVRVVRRSADHLSGLIDGILDISKIEAGRLYLSRDEVRLSEFLDQLVGMFPPSGRRQGHRLRVQASRPLAGRGLCRREAAAPGADQFALQRDQIHPDRQRAVRRALSQPRCRIRSDRHRSRASRATISNASSRRSNAAPSVSRSRRPERASG